MMRNIAIKIFILFRNYLWYSDFQKDLLWTRGKKEGQISLFGKDFFYHYGMAFYDTYNELFIKKIYDFETQNTHPVIIDCGSNMGLSVLFFSKKFPTAEIISFEPDENVFPFLEKNIKSQKLNNVQLNKKAVWVEEKDLTFYTDSGMGGRIGMEYKNKIPKIIKAVRLKDYLVKPIDMLKIDIEGPEYIILNDCKELLCNVNKIFIEYHSVFDEEQHLEDILNILKEKGFRYHLQESFSRNRPFIDNHIGCEKFDMAINVFAYKN